MELITRARRDIPDAPLLAAAAGRTPSRTPVWFMRQAGRSLPEYRQVREGIPMLDSCFMPELASTITLQPVTRHDVDAAIFFSDIVVPLKAAGIPIDIVAGRGPVVEKPIRTLDDVRALPPLDPTALAPISQAISLTLDGLTPSQALIGFAGAPFTVASYLVEGGPSKTLAATKRMMHSQPDTWAALMDVLTGYISTFLSVQVGAGIDAMQLFDSWAGYLPARDYRQYVAPYSRRIFDHIAAISDIPRIHFGVVTGELLADMSACGPDVVGVDFRVDLADAAARIPGCANLALQGNLDPALLQAGDAVVGAEIERIVATGRSLVESGAIKGHIFNLGHGVLPDTDPEAITRAVEKVHAL